MSVQKMDETKGNVAIPRADEDVGMAFAERIALLVKKYGGVTKVAQKCGFSEGVVRSWRDGRSDPSRSRCVALARGLGISLLWLMVGSGPMLDDDHKRKGNHVATTVDTHRLTDAMRVLQSTLDSTGNRLPVHSRAELLGEYYAALDNPDPVARAEGIGEIHQHLLQHIRHDAENG